MNPTAFTTIEELQLEIVEDWPDELLWKWFRLVDESAAYGYSRDLAMRFHYVDLLPIARHAKERRTEECVIVPVIAEDETDE